MEVEKDEPTWDPDHLRRRLQSMDDFDFEHLIADLWEAQGWNAEVEQQSGDAGVDVRVTRSSPYNRKSLIQAKRYSDDNPVGGPAIQQYSALKQQEPDTDEAIIVTTGRFTNSAKDRAKDLNVKIIDGKGLVSLIDGLAAYDIVEEYLGQPSGGGSRPRAGRKSEERLLVDIDDRDDLEELIGQDLDTYLEEEQYRATRAMESAQGRVKLNPFDASEIGIFDNLPEEGFERRFSANKDRLVFLKDDIHIDEEGNVYVEDLTKYINQKAIKGHESGPIIGVIERGIPDGAWLSNTGKDLFEQKKQTRRVKQKASNLYSKFKNSEFYKERISDSTRSTHDDGSTFDSDLQKQEKFGSQSESSGIDVESSAQKKERSQHESVNLDLTRSHWFYATIGGIIGWILSFAVSGALSGFLILASWVLLPVALFMDMKKTGFYSIRKNRSRAYLVGSAIPLLAIIPAAIYLYRREKSWEG
ncbi:restriction endonuclease [Haladaptatus pallidirubidus]|uniref:Restriction endonuclease type IV Mrr domain-containing protein n=1 Tax=Haladaptatus pallidirubidus TaxID=1008152 RepID=A0AAV3UGK2_9EURY|nr:restriction endonuclease [Haladaptatus pallidirubidus]